MKYSKMALLAVTTAFFLQGCNEDSNSNSNKQPIPPPDTQSEIVGVWTSDDTDSDLLGLAFLDDGTYIHVQVDEAPTVLARQTYAMSAFDSQSAVVDSQMYATRSAKNPGDGMEWGSYSIDAKTGLLTTTQKFDNNGVNGLSDTLTRYIKVSDGKMTVQIDFNKDGIIGSDETFSFSKAKSEEHLGFWRSGDSGEGLSGMAFLADGMYVQVEVDAERSLDNPENGMEWGNYAINQTTGELTTSQIFDNNGAAGLSEPLTRYVKTSAGALTLEVDENNNGIIDADESFDFSRTKPDTKPEDDLKDEPEAKSLVGLWENKDTANDLLALAFLDDGTYVHVEVDEVAPIANQGEKSGMEWGKYTLNNKTDELTVSQIFDNNGDTGLSDDLLRYARVSGDTLTFEVDENENGVIDEDESFTFTRAKSENMLGLWRNTQTSNELLAFMFFDDGTYVHLEVDEAPPKTDSTSDEISGMEWGNYSVNAMTNLLIVDQIFDNNGGTGLSDPATRYAQVSGNVLTLEIDGDSIDFQRQ